MAYTNTGSKTVKLMYKKVGKTYGLADGDGNAFIDEPTRTSYPFDEILVAPGATVDVGATTWEKTVEMSPTQTKIVRVGPQRGAAGDVVNTSANNIKVRYVIDGKRYNVPSEASPPEETDTQSAYPFDEDIVAPGRAFYVDAGVKVVKVIDMPATPDYKWIETNN